MRPAVTATQSSPRCPPGLLALTSSTLGKWSGIFQERGRAGSLASFPLSPHSPLYMTGPHGRLHPDTKAPWLCLAWDPQAGAVGAGAASMPSLGTPSLQKPPQGLWASDSSPRSEGIGP